MEHGTETTIRRRSTRGTRSRGTSTSLSSNAMWGLAAAGLALVALVALGADFAATAGRIHPGVRVAGVDVGGFERPEAAKLLEAKLRPAVEKPVKATFEAKSWDIEAQRVGARVDGKASAEAAYLVGRDGNFLSQVGQRVAAWVRPVRLDVIVAVDDERLDALLTDLDREVGTSPRDASVKVEGTEVELVSAKEGTQLKRAKARDDLVQAFAVGPRTVKLQVERREVSIADEQAEAALGDAEAMLAGPVTITYEKKSWTIDPEDIAGWIAFRTAGAEASASAESTTPARLEAYIAADEVSATVAPLTKKVGRAPKDATFVTSASGVTIKPSEYGTAVDMDALARSLTTTLRGTDEREVALRLRKIEPEVTTAKARKMGIKGRISTYTTEYAPGNKPRVNNIHTLAKALDGTLLAPGEVFSFNGSIGPRTAERGYQEAPAIVNGKLVPQLGGGVCQVGTTVFNAVFFSGLPVVERRNHSFYIDHYPKGRDATVSYGGPDLKFKNDTSTWILIRTSYSSSSITVSLYGTDPGYDVSYKTGPWTDSKPFPVTEVDDPTLPTGSRYVEDTGITGGRIVVTRTVKKGGAVVRTDTFTSNYKPKAQVVRVGTKKGSTTPTRTP